MSNPFEHLWKRNGRAISFFGKSFFFSKHYRESGAYSDGENRNIRHQIAMESLLITEKQDVVPDQQLQMAIISKLLQIIKSDNELSKWNDKKRNMLIELALKQLPLSSQLRFTEVSPPAPATQNQANTTKDKANLKQQPAVTLPSLPKKKEPCPKKQEEPSRKPRGFSLLKTEENTYRIFYGQDEIIFNHPDEHTILQTILFLSEQGKTAGNNTLAFNIGGREKLTSLYLSMKKSMDECIPASSQAISYDPKTGKHQTKRQVHFISSEKDRYLEPAEAIALPAPETHDIG